VTGRRAGAVPGAGWAVGHPARAARAGGHYIERVDKKLTKNSVRAGVVISATTLMLLISSPAFAVNRDDGDDPGSGLSVIQTLGLFVAAPIVLFGVIAGLVMVTDKSPRQPYKG
jgi:hypothetical protein